MSKGETDVVSALETEVSAAAPVSRVAELFLEDEPEWNCLCFTVVKKTAVETVGKFILFIGLVSYIMYQLSKYFDTSFNRVEVVEITTVDSMPLAFIYVDFSENCSFEFGFYNDSGYSYYNYYDEWTDYGDITDYTIQDLFDYVDNTHNCEPVWLKNLYGSWWQYLFIPSSCNSIAVDSKDYVFVDIECESNPFLLWQFSGHREQLYNYGTLDVALQKFFSLSVARDPGYDIAFVYDWYGVDNKIDSGNFYDYYDMSIDSTYVAISELWTSFRFSPNEVGTKTTFVTTTKLDLLDILGLAGGMYSTIEQVLTYFTVAIIWGFSFGCCKIKGIAHEAGPDGLIRQQLEGFLKARDETIVELTQRIIELENVVGVERGNDPDGNDDGYGYAGGNGGGNGGAIPNSDGFDENEVSIKYGQTPRNNNNNNNTNNDSNNNTVAGGSSVGSGGSGVGVGAGGVGGGDNDKDDVSKYRTPTLRSQAANVSATRRTDIIYQRTANSLNPNATPNRKPAKSPKFNGNNDNDDDKNESRMAMKPMNLDAGTETN